MVPCAWGIAHRACVVAVNQHQDMDIITSLKYPQQGILWGAYKGVQKKMETPNRGIWEDIGEWRSKRKPVKGCILGDMGE